MRRGFLTSGWIVAVVVASHAVIPSTLVGQSSEACVPVTDAMLHDPGANDWLMWQRTRNTRNSILRRSTRGPERGQQHVPQPT